MANVAGLAPNELGPTLCIGEVLVEIVAKSPGAGFREPMEFIGPYPSGAPAIFADQSARMGADTAMAGCVGDDDFGLVNIERLRNDGVDVSAILTHKKLPTGSAFVRYRPDGERDFVFNLWTSAAGEIYWSDELHELAYRAGHLHVMGTLLVQNAIWLNIHRAMRVVKARGGTVSLDPNLRKELKADEETQKRLSLMVANADLILPSDEELYTCVPEAFSGDEEATLQNLFERGVREVAIKRGKNGSTALTADGERVNAAAFDVEEIDPTGAGDCFGGAYVASRRLGLSLTDALTYANAAGARNVGFVGPMEGAGTREQLDQFIAEKGTRAS